MRCRFARARSTAYSSGELDERQMSAVRGHLRGCDDCRRVFDDESALVRAARGLEAHQPPASLWDGIAARIAEEEIADADRSRLWFWWRGFWPRTRVHALGLGLATATALVLLWPSEQPDRAAAPRTAAAGASAATDASQEPAMELGLAIGAEMARADARYQGVVAELRELAGPGDAALAAELEELSARRRAHVQDGLLAGDVFAREELYDVYREEIDVLTDAVFEREGL